MDEIRAKIPGITTLFMCASAAGGTGSGMLAATARIMAAEFNITSGRIRELPIICKYSGIVQRAGAIRLYWSSICSGQCKATGQDED